MNETLLLSADARFTAGILLLTIVAVESGGWFMLRVLGGQQAATGFQKAFFRAGHAHAGVLVILSLVAQIYADATGLTGPVAWLARSAVPLAAILMPAGFFFSARTHLTVMEYWRWWVVHLWVEGFFEVFATAALALIFAWLGLVQARHAGAAVIASSALFLFAGIPGTFHHLYFSGTPTSIMAIGATFSALEVIPLVLIGLEAWQTARMREAAMWPQPGHLHVAARRHR